MIKRNRGSTITTPPLFSGLAFLVLMLAVIVLVSFTWSEQVAKSILLGGITFIVPQAYLIYRAFQFKGARHTRQIVDSFYRGVVGKILLASIMTALILVSYRQLNVPAYFASFGLVWLANTVVTAYLINRRSNRG